MSVIWAVLKRQDGHRGDPSVHRAQHADDQRQGGVRREAEDAHQGGEEKIRIAQETAPVEDRG